MLNTRIKIVRETLREALGARSAQILLRDTDSYRCDRQLITADVWQFLDHLNQAAMATNDQQRAHARHRALDLYGGPLLDETDYLWAHSLRAELQHKAITAVLWLAEYRARSDSERAIATLEHATDTFASYEEEPYRELMKLHAALGRVDVARRTYWMLRDRLSCIDIKPSRETQALCHRLVG